jgi:hypothetical protein
MTTPHDVNAQMLQHYEPSRLQLRLMRLGLRRFRWFRRWLGGVWRRRPDGWRHHLELSPMELMALFPMVALAELVDRDRSNYRVATALGYGRDFELWSLPAGELPIARAIRLGASADRDTPAPVPGVPGERLAEVKTHLDELAERRSRTPRPPVLPTPGPGKPTKR